jgi:hypothetical protein
MGPNGEKSLFPPQVKAAENMALDAIFYALVK